MGMELESILHWNVDMKEGLNFEEVNIKKRLNKVHRNSLIIYQRLVPRDLDNFRRYLDILPSSYTMKKFMEGVSMYPIGLRIALN